MKLPTICATVVALIGCVAPCLGAPIKWTAGNGHYYDVVPVADQVTWDAALASAAAMTVNGNSGFLATITSQAEQDFIVNQFGDAIRAKWLGGFQLAGSVEPNGGWSWITGEPFTYTNWGFNEPNNSGGMENHLCFATAGSDALGVWNDLDGVTPPATFVNGYVVEFVPEPSTYVMAAMGVVTLLFVRRRKQSDAAAPGERKPAAAA